jgi:MFS family permease
MSEHPGVGRPLSEREVRSSLRTNIVAGSLGMWWAAATFGMPLPMLMESLGATGVLIGLVTTVRQITMLAQIPGAVYCERLAERKRFWAITAILHRAVWFLPALLPWMFPAMDPRLPVLIVFTVALSDLLANAGTASWFSWMAELVPERTAGKFWGTRQSVLTASGLVAAAAMGWVLDAFPAPSEPGGGFVGFSIVFAIAASLGIADIVLHLRVSEPRPTPAPRHRPLAERLIAPLRDADFRRLTFAMGAWNFSVGLAGSFGAIYLKRDFGVSYSQLSWLFIAASLGAVVSGFVIGYLVDRLGARAMATILMAVAPLCGLSWFLVGSGDVEIRMPGLQVLQIPQPIFVQLFAHLIAGALYSGVVLCQVRLATGLAPAQGRTLSMAVHWSLVGLTAALGPVCAGAVMDAVDRSPLPWRLPTGVGWSFFHVLVLLHLASAWALALPLMARLRTRKGDIPVGTALARIMVGNPLQSVRNLYTIYAASAPASKARAARHLGHARTALAGSDLAAQLDDPSHEVREEAVAALGSIGTAEAVETLARKLHDPGTDLDPQILRALRKTPGAALPAAMARLDSTDRETVTEAVRLLGHARHLEAVPALVRLLDHSPDTKITEAAAEALGRIGATEAIPPLLRRLAVEREERRRSSYALALAMLAGEAETFYLLLTGEMRERGSTLGSVRDAIRRTARGLRKKQPDAAEHLEDAFALFEARHIERDDAGARSELRRMAELARPPDNAAGALLGRLLASDPSDPEPVGNLLAAHALVQALEARQGGRD